MNTTTTKQTATSDPNGRFERDLIGTIKTVNVNEWGIRGIITTPTGIEIIFVIDYQRTDKEQIPLLSKGDSVCFTSVWIIPYKGKVPAWRGKEQAKLCKNGEIQLVQKVTPTESQNSENSSKVIISNIHSFENLQVKIKEAKEQLEQLEKLLSLEGGTILTSKDFLQATVKANLHYQRLFSAMLLVLEEEE